MITLTAPDGAPRSMARASSVCVSRFPAKSADAKTRIDWAFMSLVKESIDEAVPLVKAELPSLAVLSASRAGGSGSTPSRPWVRFR